ncbi:DUF1770 family protein [Schizosaccharomyces japonicus yFS275]|uniref:DUF1770 family protein n=1 Tax=Schizosaccharomyces japonicus (strain yFS275 / FY16936) TaxID=402676 RepID=B6K482_SCHJY|nr:DUF1770 family protein [Schizosaccharomyces japonicus yFS275]EEB08289.1 DUF1770 family protein [Schizosaccharomyces japonicus yFS275]
MTELSDSGILAGYEIIDVDQVHEYNVQDYTDTSPSTSSPLTPASFAYMSSSTILNQNASAENVSPSESESDSSVAIEVQQPKDLTKNDSVFVYDEQPEYVTPPIPDLRFQSTYYASLEKAHGNIWLITMITLRDHAIYPFLSGSMWVLLRYAFRSLGLQTLGHRFGLMLRRVFASLGATVWKRR